MPEIHANLKTLDLLPSEHFVDAGYTSADNILNSQNDYGVTLIGPVSPGANWQAGLPDGITQDQFRIDWVAQFATCPNDQRSTRWSSTTDAEGATSVSIHFAQAVCDACALRQRCTKSTHSGRYSAARPQLRCAASGPRKAADRRPTRERLARRHRGHHLGGRPATWRPTKCDIGQLKTHTQAPPTAIAINLRRTALWLMGLRWYNPAASLARPKPAQFAA